MEREQLTATVTAAQNGDSEALNLLFNTYYNDVYYFALKTLKDADLACDITQETFVEIINTIGDLKAPEAFVTWMRQVTYHQCTRYFKKKKEVLVEEDEDGNTVFDTLEEEREEFIPGEGVDQEDFRATILALLDTLSEEQRAAVLMYYYHEMSIKDIAEAQQVSEGTVKSRLNYARKSLKKSVEDYEKKHDVKLHCAGVLPLLLWLFATAGKETMPVATADTVAGGIASATGVSIALSAGGGVITATATAAAGTGLMAKIAALPVAVKIISGITAGALLIGSVAMVSSELVKSSEPTKPVVMQTEPSGGNNQGENDETTAPSGPMETIPEETPTSPEVSFPEVDTPGTDIPEEPTEEFPEEDIPADIVYPVPAGCTYTMNDGIVLAEGEYMPKTMQEGEFLTTGDYTYRYSGLEWWISVIDYGKEQYEPVYDQINGVPITNMAATFMDCSSMVKAPDIPDGVVNLDYTFAGCVSLANTPEIPKGVTSMWCTFAGCSALVNAPDIPDGVINMSGTFRGCSTLIEIPIIPKGVTKLDYAFGGCSSLVVTPSIPEGVTSLAGTFSGCSALVDPPIIPKTVTDMRSTFNCCSSLVSAPSIPEGVTDLSYTFNGFSALVNAPTIPEGVKDMDYTFAGCTSLVSAPNIPFSVSRLRGAFNECISLTGTVIIDTSPVDYYECFCNTEKPIILTGESQILAELAATSSIGNVTVNPTLLSENNN